MRYITGVHALNLGCNLQTCGDWHYSATNWNRLTIRESENSFFRDWGIELDRDVPGQSEKYNVANHIRAILDLLLEGNFALAQGMRDELISNREYTNEIFNKVWELRNHNNWEQIDRFIGKEYMMKWIEFKREKTDNESRNSL